jgi:hypothetical protein
MWAVIQTRDTQDIDSNNSVSQDIVHTLNERNLIEFVPHAKIKICVRMNL